MDIKNEITALISVNQKLNICRNKLDDFPNMMRSHMAYVSSWKGGGKDEYLKVINTLIKKTENSSARIANSSIALSQALQQYIDTENSLTSENMRLPSEDIF